jgi:hypothetical protein
VSARVVRTTDKQPISSNGSPAIDRPLDGRDLVNLKDESHYGVGDVAAGHAETAVRKAKQLVEAAEAALFS